MLCSLWELSFFFAKLYGLNSISQLLHCADFFLDTLYSLPFFLARERPWSHFCLAKGTNNFLLFHISMKKLASSSFCVLYSTLNSKYEGFYETDLFFAIIRELIMRFSLIKKRKAWYYQSRQYHFGKRQYHCKQLLKSPHWDHVHDFIANAIFSSNIDFSLFFNVFISHL